MKHLTMITAILTAATIAAGASGAEDAKTLFNRASEAMKAANYDAAAAAYSQAEGAAYSKDSKSNAANGAGYAWLKARKYADAIPAYQRATQLNPANKTAWNSMGYCNLKMYDCGLSGTEALGAAIEAFTKSTLLDPSYKANPAWKSDNLQLALASLLQATTWTAAATARAGKPAPDCSDYKGCREAGDQAEAEGDFTTAKALYEKAEADAPTKKGKAVSANLLGLLALKARNPQTAVDNLRRSTSLDSGSKLAWNNLGIALTRLYESGQGGKELVEESFNAFKKAAAIDPTYKTENLAAANKLLTELGGPAVSATVPADPVPATAPTAPAQPAAPAAPRAKPAAPATAPAATTAPAKPAAPETK